MARDNLIVGLDIGTTKICAIVGEVTSNGVDIVGIGSHPSRGLRKGVVINIDATVQAIQEAIQVAIERFGVPDLLVTSAAIAHPGYFMELSLEIFEKTMQINYFTGYKNHGTAVYHRALVGIFNESRFADNFHSSFNTFNQEEHNILFVGHSRGNAEPGTLVGGT